MESIYSFYKELKGRLSAPFFSSFIFSWLIINWKIPVSLVFYDLNELKIDGYISYIDMVQKMYSFFYFFLLPIIFALAYCFLYPILKNLILIAQTYFDSKGVSIALNVSKDEKISIQKYYELKEEIKNKNLQLQEMINEESFYHQENIELKKQLENLKIEVNEAGRLLKVWQESQNANRLNGRWEIEYKDEYSKHDITFKSNKIKVNSSLKKSFIHDHLFIDFIFLNPADSTILVILTGDYNTRFKSAIYLRWHLKWDNVQQHYVGKEHPNINFTMTKIIH